MFVGGKMVDEDQSKAELEARLIESENTVRHYETVVRNRDQELNITKRVSTTQVLSKICVAWINLDRYIELLLLTQTGRHIPHLNNTKNNTTQRNKNINMKQVQIVIGGFHSIM